MDIPNKWIFSIIHLTTWSDDNITLFHGREQFLGGFEVNIMEWGVSDDALDIRLSSLLLFLFFFLALFCKSNRINIVSENRRCIYIKKNHSFNWNGLNFEGVLNPQWVAGHHVCNAISIIGMDNQIRLSIKPASNNFFFNVKVCINVWPLLK